MHFYHHHYHSFFQPLNDFLLSTLNLSITFLFIFISLNTFSHSVLCGFQHLQSHNLCKCCSLKLEHFALQFISLYLYLSLKSQLTFCGKLFQILIAACILIVYILINMYLPHQTINSMRSRTKFAYIQYPPSTIWHTR